MPISQKADEQPADYIAPAEAQRLAFLSTKQIARLADEGRIRFIRPGKHRRYNREDVLALVTTTPTAPAAGTVPRTPAAGATSVSAA